MKIKISGHHVEITEGIKQSIENKFAKISKHYPNLMEIDSRITVEPNQQKLEVTTLYEGAKVTVNASDKHLYKAIAKVSKKLQSALAHRKGQLSAKFHNKFVVQQTEYIKRRHNGSPIVVIVIKITNIFFQQKGCICSLFYVLSAQLILAHNLSLPITNVPLVLWSSPYGRHNQVPDLWLTWQQQNI